MGIGEWLEKQAKKMQAYINQQNAQIKEQKKQYIRYSDQQLLNELVTQQKKEGWSRSSLKIKVLQLLLEERGYVHVGNGFYLEALIVYYLFSSVKPTISACDSTLF